MCLSSPSIPAPPPPPPPPAAPPTQAAEPVKRARQDARKRARALAGDKSTIATSPLGLLAEENVGTTTLLGQGGV